MCYSKKELAYGYPCSEFLPTYPVNIFRSDMNLLGIKSMKLFEDMNKKIQFHFLKYELKTKMQCKTRMEPWW